MRVNIHWFSLRSSLVALFAIVLSACQTPPLTVIHDQSPSFDNNNYQTFSVVHVQRYKESNAEELIVEAIEDVVKEKGYTLADTGSADLIVRFSIRTESSTRMEFDDTQAMVNNQLGHPPIMEAVFEARLLVNVIDARTDQVVWKSASTRDLTNVDTSKFDAERAHDRMHEMFEAFPSKWF